MSSTRCETCKGWGTICSKCGKARKLKQGRWSTKGCTCYGGKRVKCPTHEPSTWTCDVCGLKRVGTESPDVGGGRVDGTDLYACGACRATATAAQAVAIDQVLGKRTGLNAEEMAEADVVKALLDEARWWRLWAKAVLSWDWQHINPLTEDTLTFQELESRNQLRQEGFKRCNAKVQLNGKTVLE